MSRLFRNLAPVFALIACLTFSVAAFAAEAKGKIKTVTPDKSELVMSDSAGKSWTISVAKDAKVMLNDKEAKLADLQLDDEVNITYEKDGEKLNASSIKATRK